MTLARPLVCAAALAMACSAAAQDIASPTQPAETAAFDIVRTHVVSDGSDVVFTLQVRGAAGEVKPKAVGQFAGSAVFSYVWPTSLDSATVGFDGAQGILALAVTFHPDFDDAAYGGVNRHVWHPHWVVLITDEACGPGALKVRDIPAGTTPRVPATWPNVPLLIDSPEYPTNLAEDLVTVRVPAGVIGAPAGCGSTGSPLPCWSTPTSTPRCCASRMCSTSPPATSACRVASSPDLIAADPGDPRDRRLLVNWLTHPFGVRNQGGQGSRATSFRPVSDQRSLAAIDYIMGRKMVDATGTGALASSVWR